MEHAPITTWRSPSGQDLRGCVVFCRVREAFGAFSNMAGGYPLRVNGVLVPSSEALYQACRFPHRPDWQREIIAQPSGMQAKMLAKKDGRRRLHSRSDWEALALRVMRWCLVVKFARHFGSLVPLLRETGNRPIVERSTRDDRFWGAVASGGGVLVGSNRLGRLLMEIRDDLGRRTGPPSIIAPPRIPGFLLNGRPIRPVVTADAVPITLHG